MTGIPDPAPTEALLGPAERFPDRRVPPPGITIDNPEMQALQRRIALLTIVLPALGTGAAIASLWWRPITGVDVTLLVGMYVATCLGVTVGFHRLFSHRSFRAVPGLRVALGILGSMAAQGNLVYWVATHRRHHQYSEGEGDPHSPYQIDGRPLGRLRGLWHSHIGWMLDSDMTNPVRFAKDLIRDPQIARVNALYFTWVGLGLALPAAIGGLVTWSWSGALGGFLWGGVVRMFLVHHAMWTSGSTAHILGARPFATRDMSTNNPILAVPNLGEAWHNNHHAFPSSALFGLYWWQVDIGGLFIRACAALGWASDIRFPTREMVEAKRGAGAPLGPAEGDTW
jgi:stearoyl-CoA desaturase (delta-9 desaturase)